LRVQRRECGNNGGEVRIFVPRFDTFRNRLLVQRKWSAASLQLTAEVRISFCYTISVKIRSACVGGSQIAPQQLRRRVHAAAASSAAL
jgi:hypothetical protein